MVVEVSDVETCTAYMEAHRLLPPDYPSSDADMRAHMTMAIHTLEDPLSPSESVLRAILILGHTPDERALAALRNHASREGMHADMARIAVDECAWWIETSEPELEPVRPRAPSYALN
jgi:hypothetical protein